VGTECAAQRSDVPLDWVVGRSGGCRAGFRASANRRARCSGSLAGESSWLTSGLASWPLGERIAQRHGGCGHRVSRPLARVVCAHVVVAGMVPSGEGGAARAAATDGVPRLDACWALR
jgi:hypothetical protein